MTITEALGEGLVTTAVGLSIVFSVLIILMLVLMLMKVFFYKEPEKHNGESQNTSQISAAQKPLESESETGSDMDESELVAVLTAAIAASLNTSTYNLKIKSYKRVTSSAPVWNRAGLNDVINSRY